MHLPLMILLWELVVIGTLWTLEFVLGFIAALVDA